MTMCPPSVTTCLNRGVMRVPISPTLLRVLLTEAFPGDDGRSTARSDGDRLFPSCTLLPGLVDAISSNIDAGNWSFGFELSVFCSAVFVFSRCCGAVSPLGVFLLPRCEACDTFEAVEPDGLRESVTRENWWK